MKKTAIFILCVIGLMACTADVSDMTNSYKKLKKHDASLGATQEISFTISRTGTYNGENDTTRSFVFNTFDSAVAHNYKDMRIYQFAMHEDNHNHTDSFYVWQYFSTDHGEDSTLIVNPIFYEWDRVYMYLISKGKLLSGDYTPVILPNPLPATIGNCLFEYQGTNLQGYKSFYGYLAYTPFKIHVISYADGILNATFYGEWVTNGKIVNLQVSEAAN